MIFFAFLYFLSSCFLGIFFLKLILKKLLSFDELIVFGSILGLSGLALFVFFLALFLPLNTTLIIAIFVGFIVPLFFKNKLGSKPPKMKINKSFFTYLLFWGAAFTLILWQTTLKPTGDFFNASPSTYGDLPFHLSLITNFAYGDNFPPVNPIAPAEKLSYHFLADFVSAIALVLSGDLRFSLIAPMVIMGTLTAGSLFLFVFRIGKSKLAATITPLLFFLNGGVGFIKFFTNLLESKDWLFTPFRYAHIPEWGVEYPNILAEIMMAERVLFVAFPLAVFVLFFLYVWAEKKRLPIVLLSGFGLGLLLYANVYGFLTIGLLITILLLVGLLRGEAKKSLDLFCSLCIALMIVLPLLPGIFAKIGTGGGFVRISPGEWPPLLIGKQKLFFWITNFGIVPVFALITVFKRKLINDNAGKILSPLLITGLLAHVVIFQPYSWDNNRFVLYPYLAMTVLSSFVFVKIIQNANKLSRILGVVFLGLSLFSGLLVVYYDPQISSPLYSKEDFVIAEFIKKETDPFYNFVTSGSHNHLVPSLAGRKVVLGYGGYLWTHGVENLDEIGEQVKSIYRWDEEAPKLLRLYNVGYVIFGPTEGAEFPDLQEEEFVKRYNLIYDANNYKIFDTRDL